MLASKSGWTDVLDACSMSATVAAAYHGQNQQLAAL